MQKEPQGDMAVTCNEEDVADLSKFIFSLF